MKRGCLLRLLMAACLLAGAHEITLAQDATVRPFNFAVIGDVPYYPHEEVTLKSLLRSLGREPLEFVVHVGNIKSATSRCDKALYLARRILFANSPRPFVLVPGENDWIACERPAAGGYDATKQLPMLRDVFFEGDFSLGAQVMQLERQSASPGYSERAEHTRWTVGTVVFLTLNVAGNGNHFGTSEARERMRAVSAWLHAGFEKARALDSPGIVIFFHGDPHFELATRSPKRRPYAEFVDEIAVEAKRFGKPVLLVHGDRQLFAMDQPWKTGPRLIPEVTRFSAFGSPYVNWVRVRVDPCTKDLFRVEPEYGSPEATPSQ